MQFDKQTVVDLIQQQMGSQHAEQAAQKFPDSARANFEYGFHHRIINALHLHFKCIEPHARAST